MTDEQFAIEASEYAKEFMLLEYFRSNYSREISKFLEQIRAEIETRFPDANLTFRNASPTEPKDWLLQISSARPPQITVSLFIEPVDQANLVSQNVLRTVLKTTKTEQLDTFPIAVKRQLLDSVRSDDWIVESVDEAGTGELCWIRCALADGNLFSSVIERLTWLVNVIMSAVDVYDQESVRS